jgi:hypothetical protein
MKWHKATNEQLETIFNYEYNLPNHLLVGLVGEMISRKMFDGMIISQAKRLMGSFDRDEVLQVAYIGLYQLAKIIKNGKQSLKNMCFIVVERRLRGLQRKPYYKNNFMNQQALQHEVPEMFDAMDVEKTVIRKLSMQEQFSRLTDKQKNIICMFLEGFSLRWIGLNVYKQDTSAIRYQFKKALEAMDIKDFAIGKGA